MTRRVTLGLATASGLMALYLATWPVPIDPVAWTPPPSPGYTGVHAANDRLRSLERLDLGGSHGPEAIALDAAGYIYAATHEGRIVRLQPDGTSPEVWVETGGRPLGIAFDEGGNLIVADGYLGLLSVAQGGQITVLATDAGGVPIGFCDDLDVAADGTIYFSDASTKFAPRDWGGTYEASLLDIVEHGGHGRLLSYDPATGETTVHVDGLQFANGVAVSADQRSVLVCETAAYRVQRYWLDGPRRGQAEVLIESLPGFPDNISRGREGRYWVALATPRNALLDGVAGWPRLRRAMQRLPPFARPKPIPYGHLIAVDDDGRVVHDLQDPEGGYPMVTSATEIERYLYVGSLLTPVLGRLAKEEAGF